MSPIVWQSGSWQVYSSATARNSIITTCLG